MIRRVKVLLLVLVALAGLRTVVEAQDDDSLYGQPVVSVTFTIEGSQEVAPNIVALSEVRVGQPLRRQDVTATIRRLDALGRFDGIAVDGLAVPGGVAVTWRLVPRHPITRLEIRGEPGVQADDVEGVVRQRFGGVPTTERLSVVENAAETYLREQGYLDAEVVAETEVTHNPDRATLVLNVKAGPLVVLTSTTVRSDAPITEAEVIRRTETRVGAPFRRRAIESALSVIEDELRARGYYEAQATLSPASRSDAGVDILLTIETGPRVEVRVVPAGSLPGSQDVLIPLRRLGSADEDLLEDSRAAIERELRARGYWRASAPFARVADPDTGVLVITFTIARGPRFFVEEIDLPTSLSLPSETVRKLINVVPGQVFDESAFLRGLAAVLDLYRRNGYYLAKAEPTYEELGVTEGATRATVILHPRITEGPQGRISAISFALGDTPPVPEATLRAAMGSQPGAPFVAFQAASDRAALARLFEDRGFRRARVEVRPVMSEDGRDVRLNVTVEPGAQIRIGEIAIVGNDGVAESEIRDALQLNVGDPAGSAAIADAIARVNELGVFRRANITSLDAYSEAETQLVVTVVESPNTTIAPSGGIEGGRFPRSVPGGGIDDLLEFAPRGALEITRRNIGGRNRTASLFARVTLKRDPRAPEEGVESGGFGFTEYRVNATFRERNVMRTRTDLLIGLTSEQARRTTFNFIRQSGTLELYRPLTRQVSISGRYNLEFTKLFDQRFCNDNLLCEAAIIDRAFPQVRLSLLSLGASWDRRDRPLTTTRGTYITTDLEGAFRKIGSQVGYVKGVFEASGYRRLGQSDRTVAAVRAQLGLASGFAREALVEGPDGVPELRVVDDLPASKRFFAGGSTTVRGFQLDRLAVPELLSRDNGLPLGGNGQVILNAEVRRYLTQLFGRNLGGVVFLDGGNVFARANEIDLRKLRAAAGFGVRYDSPLGPVRLDFGFKLKPGVLNGTRERGWEYHVSIGEAF